MKWIPTSLIIIGASLQMTTATAQELEHQQELSVKLFGTNLTSFPSATDDSSGAGTPLDQTQEETPGQTLLLTQRNLRRPQENTQPFRAERLPFRPRTNQTQQQQAAAASPGVTIMTPSAYGVSWGSAGVGLGLQERTRYTETSDGVFGFGIGFGDPRKYVGLAVGITVTDLWGDTFQDGTLSLKVHRQLPEDFNVAVGWQGVASWGVTDGGSSPYGVVTKRFVLNQNPSVPLSQVYVSVGLGGGQYRSEDDINNNVNSIGAFGSVSVRLNEQMSAIAEWTGQDMTLGLSIVPYRQLPLVISPAITDITGTAGDGTRLILGIGYGFSFNLF